MSNTNPLRMVCFHVLRVSRTSLCHDTCISQGMGPKLSVIADTQDLQFCEHRDRKTSHCSLLTALSRESWVMLKMWDVISKLKNFKELLIVENLQCRYHAEHLCV